MVTVEYVHALNYMYDEIMGRQFPKLLLTLVNPKNLDVAIETDAYLDTGAERSIFKADLARALDLVFDSGLRMPYGSIIPSGGGYARIHLVILSHPDLGEFPLDIGFAEGPHGRNLLGRDFFNLMQIGFRENQQIFYVTMAP